jgi:hypothetical protein
LHLRVDDTEVIEDAMIDGLVAAAVDQAEQFLCRPLLTTGFRYTQDAFPGHRFFGHYVGHAFGCVTGDYDDRYLRIPIGGVSAVSEVGYVDTDGAAQIMDPSTYLLDTTEPTARIAPAWATFWPFARHQMSAVHVNFQAGYGTTANVVPAAIVAAVKLILGNLYANRESVVVGTAAVCLPYGAEHLMWPHRVWPLRSGG